MKKNLFFAIAITATMLFTSCYQVCYENPLPPDRPGGQTVFTGTVGDFSTRITTNELGQWQWSPGDAIGIFALPTGGTLAGSTLTANNHRFFTNVASGIFTPAAPIADNQIILPAEGNFDFIAYHPHTTPLTGNVLSVNVATTTNPSSALDLLWTHAVNPGNTPVVPLAFTRRMSQIRVYVRAAQPTTTLPLTGLTAEIDGVLVNASMNLEDGVVTASTAGTLNATTAVTTTGGYDIALTPWLFVPPQTLNNIYITLETSERKWEDILVSSSPVELLVGTRRNIVIYVNADGSRTVIIEDPTNIPDWNDGGNIYVPGPPQIPTLPPPTFGVSVTSVTLAGYIGATSTIAVTAPDGVAWSVTENSGGWLDVTTNTLGSGTITLKTEEENDTNAPRTAIVTVSLDDDPTEYFEIEVKQGAMPRLLFPGSNFNDWTTFTNSLSIQPLVITNANVAQSNIVTQHSATGGMNNSGALHIYGRLTGNPTPANPQLFSANLAPGALVGASYVHFYVRGTSVFRSLSATFTQSGSPAIVGAFNLFSLGGANVTLDASFSEFGTPNPIWQGAPSYGSNANPANITTGNNGANWTRVTLNLSTITSHPNAVITDLADIVGFQIRAGGARQVVPADGDTPEIVRVALYNLFIDNITIE